MKHWPGRPEKEKTSFGRLSRAALMSRIRSSGNKTTELRLMVLLREAGIKGWRRKSKLSGKPDFVFPLPRIAVFVDGCFWHGHDCGRNLTPKTNAGAWRRKIHANKTHDKKIRSALNLAGWKVLRLWECKLRKDPQSCITKITEEIMIREKTCAPRKAIRSRASISHIRGGRGGIRIHGRTS